MKKMSKDNKYSVTIGWLYPELMSTYGDRGNIIVLQKRCEWRGIKTEIKKLNPGFKNQDLKKCDLLFMGGAQDRQQAIVAKDLRKKRNALKKMIEDGTPGLYICGAYQFLGKYYKEADGTVIQGLNIFNLYSENPGENCPRLIGNILIQITGINHQPIALVGFENHGGRTYLEKNIKPLGRVIKGCGNNGRDKTEGAIYRNSIGTYLHGPILPKNPELTDFLIKTSLEKKYKTSIELFPLNDFLEEQAHKAILKKLNGNSSF